MTYSLRECVPGDENTLALIGQSTFLETFAGVLAGPDILAHCETQHAPEFYARWLRRCPHFLWLAETNVGQAPIGYFGVDQPDLPVPDPRTTDIELKRIYVLSRFHGTGVGRALLEQALSIARQAGKERLLLGVYARNERALAFYRRNGFTAVAQRRFTVGKHAYEDTVLARVL